MNAIKTIDFIYKNYYKWIELSKEESYYPLKHLKKERLLLLANKLTKNIRDPRNAKEHYEWFLRKKNRKSVKQFEIITYQPKTFKTVDIKLDNIKHPKNSHKLSKTIRKGEKVDSNNSLYSERKKCKFFELKKCKNNNILSLQLKAN